jgi:hypothetical protein
LSLELLSPKQRARHAFRAPTSDMTIWVWNRCRPNTARATGLAHLKKYYTEMTWASVEEMPRAPCVLHYVAKVTFQNATRASSCYD